MATTNVESSGELWVDVQGYEGHYKINRLGEVYSLKSRKLITPYVNNTKYVVISLHKNNMRNVFLLHRLIAIHFIPNSEGKPFINHIDGVKSNYTIENLEWVTAQENGEHASRTGLLANSAKKAKVRMKAIGAKYGSENIKIAQAVQYKRFAKLDANGQQVSTHTNMQEYCNQHGYAYNYFWLCLKQGKPYKGTMYSYL